MRRADCLHVGGEEGKRMHHDGNALGSRTARIASSRK